VAIVADDFMKEAVVTARLNARIVNDILEL
jgi:hypothetical protein